jgi:hypothetical protein
MPPGLIIGGILGSNLGLHETIWVGAIGGLFAFLPILLSPVVGLREIPAMTPEAGTETDASPGPDVEEPSWPGPGPAPDS